MAISSLSNPTSSGPSQSTAGTQLSRNFNNFLLLLTQQLKMQDPTQPMDTEKFTQQLVQFASVEQQMASNSKLDKLIDLEKGRETSAALSYVGKAVEIESRRLSLIGASADFSVELKAPAKTVEIRILNEKNEVVRTLVGPPEKGKHNLNWDGRDKNGVRLPPGTYSLSVDAKDMEGKKVDTSTTTFGIVENVELNGSKPKLTIGKLKIDIDDVLVVRPGPSESTDSFGSALGYLNKSVEAYSNLVYFQRQPVTPSQGGENAPVVYRPVRFLTEVGSTAIATRIQILDKDGKLVRTLVGRPGQNMVEWDGKNSKGEYAPAGPYTVRIEANDQDLKPVAAASKIFGQVSGIDTSGNEPLLLVDGIYVRPADVARISGAPAA